MAYIKKIKGYEPIAIDITHTPQKIEDEERIVYREIPQISHVFGVITPDKAQMDNIYLSFASIKNKNGDFLNINDTGTLLEIINLIFYYKDTEKAKKIISYGFYNGDIKTLPWGLKTDKMLSLENSYYQSISDELEKPMGRLRPDGKKCKCGLVGNDMITDEIVMISRADESFAGNTRCVGCKNIVRLG